MQLMKWRHRDAIGTLVLLWHDSQEALKTFATRKEICSWLDAADGEEATQIFDALLESNYISVADSADQFEIRGNKKHVAAALDLKKKQKNGGAKSGEARRKSPTKTKVIQQDTVDEKNRSGHFNKNEVGTSKNRSHFSSSLISSSQDNALQDTSPQFKNGEGNGELFAGMNSGENNPEKNPIANRATWEAYREAYLERWKVEPTRNKTVNIAIANFVKRVGSGDAPDVIRFYVRHNDGFYVKATHSVPLALRDAESLRTQWLKGRAITTQDVRNFEKVSHMQAQLERIDRGEV